LKRVMTAKSAGKYVFNARDLAALFDIALTAGWMAARYREPGFGGASRGMNTKWTTFE